ncbi:tape measure protein [Aeromonas veronii]|uniref:tape measure protein n=1 Tax=Aeromonas veronii TaxID=654 RepID=UPI001F3B9DEB|nr:tape measure protein [Aeromonas veronii]MCF5728935.1 tape measure protein [Aeromonas veronii]
MSVAGDVRVGLVLEGADEFKVQVVRAADSLDRIANKMDDYARATEKARRANSIVSTSIREMALNMELARLTIANLSAGLTALPRALLEQASFFDKTTLLLAGLNVETATFAEAQKQAAVEVKNLMSAAASSPYKMNALVDAYTKLKAADLASPDGFLAGLMNTAGKFGKSSEELKRASVAIQQMAGKGVISMEELRQQFGEAVPDAMGMMARAASVSMGDLVKQVSTGTVEAKQALELLSREMYLSSAGAAVEMTKTWDGALNRISTSLTELAVITGDTGFYDNAVGLANAFNSFLKSDEVVADANRLGLVLTDLSNMMAAVAAFIYDHAKELTMIIGAMFGASWANKIISGVGALTEAYKAESAKWPESTRVVQNQMLELQRDFQRRGLALEADYLASRSAAQDRAILNAMDANKRQYDLDRAALQERLQTLQAGQSRLSAMTNSVANMFGGWTNVIVAAIGVALYALDEFYLKQRRIADQVIETGGLVASFEDLQYASKQMAEDKTRLQERKQGLEESRQAVSALTEAYKLTNEQVRILNSGTSAEKMGLAQKLGLNSVQSGKLFSTFDDVKRADSEIKAMESRIKRANEAISSAKEHVSETFRNQGSGVVANIMAAPLRQVSMEYEKAAKKAEAAAKQESAKYKDDAKAANDAYQKVLTEKLAPARQKAIASMNSIFEGESKAIAAQMEKLKSEKPADGSNESLVLERDKQLAILEGRLERVNKDWDTFKEAISVSHEGLDRLASQMAKTGKIDPSVSYMQSSKIFTAGKQEEIKMQKVALGLLDEQAVKGKELAKLEAAIAAGKYKSLKSATIEQMKIDAMARDMANTEFQEIKERARLRRTTVDRLDDLSISISKKMGSAKGRSDNPLLEWQRAAEQTNEAIKEIEANLKKASGVLPDDAAKIAEIMQKQRMADQYNIAAKMNESIRETNEAMMPNMARTRAEFDRQIAQLDELLDLEMARLNAAKARGTASKEEADLIQKNIDLIKKQRELTEQQKSQQTTIYGVWKRSLEDMKDGINEKLGATFEGVFDAFAAGIVEGKDSFKDMMDSLTKDLEKFLVKMAMMQMFESTLGGFFGGGGGGKGGKGGGIFSFANGGIMSELGSVPLRKYAKGGVATSPQLALFGEGSMNEAYVPLPDGRTIPVTMTGPQAGAAPTVHFNLINQSGMPVEAENRGQKFDGEKYIIDVVLNAMSRPGRLRTAMQGVK